MEFSMAANFKIKLGKYWLRYFINKYIYINILIIVYK